MLVVTRRSSRGADALRAALRDLGHGEDHSDRTTVGWGVSGCDINSRACTFNKQQELWTLAAVGVPVPPHTDQKPPRDEILAGLWLGRTPNHRRATDLLRPRAVRRRVTFWTRRLDIAEEFRCHVFRHHRQPNRYLVVRSGRKVFNHTSVLPSLPCTTTRTSSWIRSSRTGWTLVYSGTRCNDYTREYARRSVEALGLDFGAVDLGILANGEVVVLEVNTTPDLGPLTAREYAERLVKLCP